MSSSLERIWERGCRGEDLKTDEMKKFAAMARSRFHTFVLGMEHADKNADQDAADGLVRGLASEIKASPGLRKLWMNMSVNGTSEGQQVTLQLERLESTLH